MQTFSKVKLKRVLNISRVNMKVKATAPTSRHELCNVRIQFFVICTIQRPRFKVETFIGAKLIKTGVSEFTVLVRARPTVPCGLDYIVTSNISPRVLINCLKIHIIPDIFDCQSSIMKILLHPLFCKNRRICDDNCDLGKSHFLT